MFKRIHDWITRPSREVYLDDHQAAVNYGVRAEAAEAALAQCLKANEEINEDAASRLADAQIAYDRKTKQAMDCFRESEELRTEIGRLNEQIDGLTRLNMTLNGDLQAACDDRDRLRKLGIEQVENTPVHRVSIEDGAIEVITRPPHWAVLAMAASFVDTLDGAPNWRSIEIGPMPSTEGRLIVTVCRASGDSPAETCTKLKALLEEWHEFYSGDRNGDDALVARTLTMLNPEKKD